jgi:hypothetical protein
MSGPSLNYPLLIIHFALTQLKLERELLQKCRRHIINFNWYVTISSIVCRPYLNCLAADSPKVLDHLRQNH